MFFCIKLRPARDLEKERQYITRMFTKCQHNWNIYQPIADYGMIYQYLVGFFMTNEYYNNTGEMYCRPNMVKHEILVKYDLFYQYIYGFDTSYYKNTG